MSRSISIYSWNVNGIRATLNKGAFQAFIAKYDPDILCLQETKAQEGQAEIDLPDEQKYHEYWYSAAKKGYSGTAIFSKQPALSVLKGLSVDIAEKFGLIDDEFGSPNDEGRVLAAEYPDFWLVTVYTPNAKRELTRLKLRHEQWDPAFLAYLKQLEKSKPVVFCGDLNVAHTEDDLANPKANRGLHGFTDEERGGFDAFLKAGFIDTFRLFTPGNGHYSWWAHWADARARNIGWRIDYFLVSAVLRARVKAADIRTDVMGSDHCPVSVTLDI